MSDEITGNTALTEVGPTILPRRRVKVLANLPGFMAYASPNGHFPGCIVRRFDSISHLNEYFSDGANMDKLCVGLVPASGVNGDILAIITKTLDDDELSLMTEHAEAFEAFKEERKAKKDAAERLVREGVEKMEAQVAAKKAAAMKELERLAQLGARCEKHHRGKGK